MAKSKKGRGRQRRAQPAVHERTTPVAEVSSVAEVEMRLASPTEERVGSAEAPDPEVTARAARRRFSAAYKLQILRTADACAGAGEVGTVLRRGGLYSSPLTTWRPPRGAGGVAARAPQKAGPPGGAELAAGAPHRGARARQRGADPPAPPGGNDHRCP